MPKNFNLSIQISRNRHLQGKLMSGGRDKPRRPINLYKKASIKRVNRSIGAYFDLEAVINNLK